MAWSWGGSRGDDDAAVVKGMLEHHPEWGGLNRLELNELAIYNAETSRGLLHSEQWKEKMAALQARFDSAKKVGRDG